MKMNKRGQEEIVGFIVIVVIVTIAAVILLLLSARQPAALESSQEIENFLQSSMYLTTECQSLDLSELIKACYDNEMCDQESGCSVLNRTFANLLAVSWSLDRYQGYYLSAYASENNQSLIDIKAGNQSGNSEASRVPLLLSSGNKIYVYLKVYAKAE